MLIINRGRYVKDILIGNCEWRESDKGIDVVHEQVVIWVTQAVCILASQLSTVNFVKRLIFLLYTCTNL